MPRMRTRATIAAGLAALAIAGVASQAPAQDPPRITLEVDSFQILRQDGAAADAIRANVLHQGEKYQFRIHYTVDGSSSIRTGHTFAFENVSTGRRVDVDSRSFDPEPGGTYNEYSARVIPDSWQPGVYRLVWTLRASAVDAESATLDGSLAFLVAGPLTP